MLKVCCSSLPFIQTLISGTLIYRLNSARAAEVRLVVFCTTKEKVSHKIMTSTSCSTWSDHSSTLSTPSKFVRNIDDEFQPKYESSVLASGVFKC